MKMTCKSCRAEIAGDAETCWNCNATGVAMRGKGPGPVIVLALAALVGVGAIVGGTWWAVFREGAPFASLLGTGQAAAPVNGEPAPTDAPPQQVQLPDWMRPLVTRPRSAPTPAAPAGNAAPVEVSAAGEAILVADPVDGPFYVMFKQALPADYAAMIGPLLAQVPDPAREAARFDMLLSEKLEAFQGQNAGAIAGAESSVLAAMATNMQRAMRTPEICQSALQATYQPLAHGNLEARRIASASNQSLVSAIASGRVVRATRFPPSAAQVEAFNLDLKTRLLARQWTTFQEGKMDVLPLDEQCSILAAYWGVIASLPAEESAQWTAYLMNPPAAQ